MEAYIKGKNVNTVEFPDKCFVCGKDKCDDYIKIELIIPMHSDSKCFINHTHEIMKLNECGNPFVNSVKTLKKFIKLIEKKGVKNAKTNWKRLKDFY